MTAQKDNAEWWKENIHRFTVGFSRRFKWNSDFIIALKEHGLPEKLAPGKANATLKRIGSSLRFDPDGWTSAELLQLRAISRLPLLKRRGWSACLRMAYRAGVGKTTINTHKHNDKE